MFLVMRDERERLRIMNHHKIVIQNVSNRVLISYLLVNLHFQIGQVNVGALQRVVDFFGDVEVVRTTQNGSPFGRQANVVQQKRER